MIFLMPAANSDLCLSRTACTAPASSSSWPLQGSGMAQTGADNVDTTVGKVVEGETG